MKLCLNQIMNRLERVANFCKVSLLAGIGILLPLVLLAFLIGKALTLISKIADPVARSLFPVEYSLRGSATEVIAIVLLILLSMALGFAAQTMRGQRFGMWLESHTLMHIPMYRAVKEFSARLIPSQSNTLFQPALLIRKDEMNTLIFVVEALSNGYYVIFIPTVPSAFIGVLQVVPKTDVEILHVPVMDVVKTFSRWGVGTGKVLEHSLYMYPRPDRPRPEPAPKVVSDLETSVRETREESSLSEEKFK